jgi:hypothetical protein
VWGQQSITKVGDKEIVWRGWRGLGNPSLAGGNRGGGGRHREGLQELPSPHWIILRSRVFGHGSGDAQSFRDYLKDFGEPTKDLNVG